MSAADLARPQPVGTQHGPRGTVPAAGSASELAPEDAREMLDRQAEVLELIAGAAPLRAVLTLILTSLEHLMPGARCSVLLLDRERGTLHHGAAPSLPPDYTAAIDGLPIGEHAGSCGTAAAINAPVVATDVRTDARWADYRELAGSAGLRSCWSTPIEGSDGMPVGTFAVYHQRPHRPSSREQLLVDRFTHLAAVAIEHAGLVGDLVESEERFRRSFDDNSLGMAIVGLDRVVVTSNVALTELGGQDPVGRPLADLLTAKGRSLDSRLEQLGRRGGGPVAFEGVLHRTARPVIEVEVTVSLLRGRDGSPAQYVVNVLDLTERRMAERERRARSEAETARRTAEELSHAKSELLAAVGHEARTPIQAIVGFAELLGTIDLDEARRREALGHISAAAGHVMDLLADVLDLSRIEANALPLVLEAVRLSEVVDEAFGLLSETAAHRGVTLTHELDDDLVHVDRRRLRQVLLNLLTNAIRHGNPDGHVAVRTRPSGDDTTVLVAVQDDGPGIPAALLPVVFTPFSRGASAPRKRPARPDDPAHDESVGLGLGLAHGLVCAMGGDLTVGETSPAGTAMLVRIRRPVAPSG
ncbi:PAS domain S-box-containing protein [Pedococcus dokdonensis]|uniref:histidine kinase n=1 Tax=Pedococcus dokdonensis TaxID=443156 RepID=A0A1H0N7R7_9MICO|nr:ATP-binding protein [Pedococcus dokdonensis]SDO88576.1 PAS domain S-box-containing protein [Pedococcus dokdonensis]